MAPTQVVALDPPLARRLRLLAPALVLIGFALLALMPGILIHDGDSSNHAAQRVQQFMTYEGR